MKLFRYLLPTETRSHSLVDRSSKPYVAQVVLDFVVRKYSTATGNTRSFYFVVSHLTLLRFTTQQ